MKNLDKAKLSKLDLSILIGNCLEHYDAGLYGVLAPILAPVFFPNNDFVVSLILTYLSFITGYLLKPVGAFIFGVYASKKGPLKSLSSSLYGISFLSLIISITPSYQYIGISSPLLFILIRAIKSFFIGGETAVSKLYILSNKTENQAFKNSIYYQISTIVGIMLASLIVSLILFFKIDYMWRICYLFSGITGLIGLYLRTMDKKIKSSFFEKGTSSQIHNHNPFSILKLISNQRLIITKGAIANGFSYMTYIIPFVIMNSFIPLISNISIVKMMIANNIFLIVDLVLIILFSRYLIRFNYNKIMLISTFVFSITFLPIWYFVNTSFVFVCFVRIWIVFWGIVYLCPLNLWQYNVVKDLNEHKYLITGIANNLGAIIIGKSLPSICFLLYRITHHHIAFGIYICILTFLTFFVIKRS